MERVTSVADWARRERANMAGERAGQGTQLSERGFAESTKRVSAVLYVQEVLQSRVEWGKQKANVDSASKRRSLCHVTVSLLPASIVRADGRLARLTSLTAMEDARPLSLRERIRQLEQAAHSPLTDTSSTRHNTTLASKGPTSARRLQNGTATHTSLAVQQVAHADDPLQQSADPTRLSSASSPPSAARTSGRSAQVEPPPPKPPRPVWVTSNARETPTDPLSIDTGSKAGSGRGERDRIAGGGDSLARSSDAAPRREHPSTQAPLQGIPRPASPSGSISPTTRSIKPALPARPPAVTVTSPIRSDPLPPSSASHPTAASARVDSPGTGTPAAPALPPRPAWARKPSPATSPGSPPASGWRESTPAPTFHSERQDSSLRDTASSAGSTGTSLAAVPPPAPGTLSGSSSPALPPRPQRGAPAPAPQQKTDTRSSAVVSANARRRYDRLFSQCVEAAAATARPTLGSEERLDGAVIGELWRRSRLDDAVLRRIWCVRSVLASSVTIPLRRRSMSAGRSVHVA